MKKYNYIVSGVMLAISGYILYEVSGYSTGASAQKSPDLWPGFLAIALAALSVLLIIETLLIPGNKNDEKSDRPVIDWGSAGMKRVYAMFALAALFVIVMKIFGMLIALFLLIPIVEWLMGCRSRLMLIALPTGMVIFVYLFFSVLMKITLPEPFWM